MSFSVLPHHQPRLFDLDRVSKPPTSLGFSFAVLVPDRKAAHLFVRPESGRMRYHGLLLSPAQLLDHVSSVPQPAIIALAGNAPLCLSVLLPHHSLFVVPDAWLAHLPAHAVGHRARAAARIVHAHILDPIRLCASHVDEDVPF